MGTAVDLGMTVAVAVCPGMAVCVARGDGGAGVPLSVAGISAVGAGALVRLNVSGTVVAVGSTVTGLFSRRVASSPAQAVRAMMAMTKSDDIAALWLKIPIIGGLIPILPVLTDEVVHTFRKHPVNEAPPASLSLIRPWAWNTGAAIHNSDQWSAAGKGINCN